MRVCEGSFDVPEVLLSLALYRKYRPGTFAEVKGQEHVTGPLRQALTNGRIHHAYLFSGPRGCGKTSSARILARSLNCEQGPTPDPCGVCDSCVALAPNGSGSLDVIEIDAASHNGVDDARDLRDKAFYAPVSARFKVYIIDEAHMVTTAAFNALLKLVEEPPEFVKFVFATTEPEKVLQTIRSRTHHYPFRLMPRRDLTALLTEVLAAEGIAAEPPVIPLVVRAAAGSARDGLSILDQVLASAGEGGVTREAAAGLLGVTPDVLLDDVLDAFAVGDATAVFGTVDRVMEGGHDPRRFAADVLERLRDLVILDAVPDAGSKGVLDCPAEQLERMARQVAAFGTAGLSRAADLFHAGLTEMRGTTAPRLLLELVCARVLLPTASSDAVVSRVERLERRFDIGGPSPAAPPAAAPPFVAHPPPYVAPSRVTPTPAAPGPLASSSAAADPAVAGAASKTPVAPERPLPGTPDDSSDLTAWPPPAAPGGASAASAAVSTAAPSATAPSATAPPVAGPAGSPEAVGPGGLDAAEVRRAWDAILLRVKESKRVTHARLSETTVAALEGTRLSVSFTTPTLARQFAEGVHVDVLKEALREVLGADLSVVCVSGGSPGGGSGGRRSSGRGGSSGPPDASRPGRQSGLGGSGGPGGDASRPVPVPPHEGFAPGDEAADDDGGDVPVERGEDAALRLVERALGGRVVGTIGE